MLITVSRRTDLPAFYTPWFMNRLRAGYCTVPNPFNAGQVSLVDLRPQAVDAFIFVSRNYRPLLPHIEALDRQGYRAVYHGTLMDNPRLLDDHTPSLRAGLRTLSALADRVGKDCVIWRYDPIVISNQTPLDFHRRTFETIARALKGRAFRVIISLVDPYPKAVRRWEALVRQGLTVAQPEEAAGDFLALAPDLAEIAARNGMEIESCSERFDLSACGIRHGACIDGAYIARRFNLALEAKKDAGQRDACGCSLSRDVGMYDTCLHGCVYCYATNSFERARLRRQAHDPNSPSLVGWAEVPEEKLAEFERNLTPSSAQLRLL